MKERGLLLLLAPYLLGIAALIAVPAVITFGLSAYEYDLIDSPRFVGLDNFDALLDDEVFRTALRNSLLFVLFAVPLRLAGALALALLLHHRFRGAGVYRTAAYLPTIVPDVAYALLWLWIFNPLYGPLNLAMSGLGLPVAHWLTDPDAAKAAIVIMSAFQIGEGFLVALAARQGIPQHLYDLAAIEAAKPLYVFRRVTFPLMLPTLLLLLFRDTVFSFQVNFVPALLVTEGGPPPYSTTYLPLFVYQQGFEYLRYGYAAAATLIMFGVTALIVYIQWRIAGRWRRSFTL